MVCPTCQNSIKPNENTAILSEKRADAVNNGSEERGRSIAVTTGNKVHTACRRDFFDRCRINRERRLKGNLSKKNRLQTPLPDLQLHALTFRRAAYSVVRQWKYARSQVANSLKLTQYENHIFDYSISEMCKSMKDHWAPTVPGWINSKTSDIHAGDTIYH